MSSRNAHGTSGGDAGMDFVSTPVRPDQFPPLPPEIEIVEVPAANHTFDTPDGITRSATMRLITDATAQWIERRLVRT